MSKLLRKIFLPLMCVVMVLGICGAVACTTKVPKETYAITIEDSEHGTITSDCEEAEQGKTVTLTATPDEGYYLLSLSVNDEAIDFANGKATFKMPAVAVTVKGSFAKEGEHSINVGDVANAKITANKKIAEEGETVTLTVSVDYGYQLTELKLNGTDLTVSNGKATFTMPDAVANVTGATAKVANIKTEANPAEQLTLTSKIGTDTATSYWNAEYGDEALEITVYVLDGKVTANRDSVEIYFGKAGYAYANPSEINFGVKITADGTVTKYVYNDGYKATDEGKVTVESVLPWSKDGASIDGYFVKVSVPYANLGFDSKPADGAITVLPVLANYTSSLGTTSVYGGYEKTNTGAYLEIKGGKWEENYYSKGAGALGSIDGITASNGWDLSKDYAKDDVDNYANREAKLNATSPDDDVVFFRSEGKDAYAEAAFKADGSIKNNEKLGKFGLMLFDGSSKRGLFFYVEADANGNTYESITGTGLGYTFANGSDFTWGHDHIATGVYSKDKAITLKMAYDSANSMIYMYYVDGAGQDVMVQKARYKAQGDVVMGIKSFNIDITVSGYYATNDKTDAKFAEHIKEVSEEPQNQLGDSSSMDAGVNWDLSKDYKDTDANYADREVKLTGHDGEDNNIFFRATEGKSAYVRATFTVDEIYNNEQWGKFGFMFFDGVPVKGVFFYVDASVGDPYDGVIKGRQLGYNYAANGWGSWNGLNKHGNVFDTASKTITLAMTYDSATGVISMYFENSEGQDVLAQQVVYTVSSSNFVIGIKSFAYGLTVKEYTVTTEKNNDFNSHNPEIVKQDIDVLFAGDSWMEFWKNYGVWDTLTYDLTKQGKKLVDVGVGGTQVPYWDNDGQIQSLKLQYNVGKIAFHIGVNDMDSKELTVQDVVTRLENLFKNYHTAFPSAQIYWVNLTPNNFFIKNNDTETFNAEYRQINEGIKPFINANAYVTLIDVAAAMSAEDGGARTNMYYDDIGLHLNTVYGYPLWTSLIKRGLGYTVAGFESATMGNVTERGGERSATPAWVYGINGNLAEIPQTAENGKSVNIEETVYYKGLYAADLLFEAEIRSNGKYANDIYSKVGVTLVNDDVTIFAYLEAGDAGSGNGANVSNASLVARGNKYINSQPRCVADWNWDNQAGGGISARNINTTFTKIGIAKLGATIYLLVDGNVVAQKNNFPGVTANSKFVAGVMGFSRYIEVKSATAETDVDKIQYAMYVPHAITVPTIEGVTVTPDKTTAKNTDTVGFTVTTEKTIGEVSITYGGGNKQILTEAGGKYSFTMPDADVTINVVVFGQMSITLGAGVADNITADSLSVVQGNTVTFTAKDNVYIKKLYAEGASGKKEITPNAGVYSFEITEDITVTGEFLFTVDGFILDGVRDTAYGTTYTEAFLNDNRNMQVWAKKTASGVLIYAMSHSNEYKDDGGDGGIDSWWDNSNFEFYLNEGVQRCVNSRDFSANVTKFFTSYKRLASGEYNGKWENIYEIYVAKEDIPNFGNDIQLNYAFKTGNGIDAAGYTSDYDVHGAVNINGYDWWSHHAVGGADVAFWTEFSRIGRPRNLFISTDGIKIVKAQATQATIDGNLTEYADKAYLEVGDAAKATFKVSGFAGNDGLYLAFTVTHGEWSPAVPSGDWSTNDNIEIHINCIGLAFVFINGKLTMPAFVSQYASNTTQSGGKNVTTVEVFIAGNADRYRIQFGCNGDGFGGWQSLMWGGDVAYVTASGVSRTNDLGSIATAAGITLDGNFTDSVWTSTVKSKELTQNIDGQNATVKLMGVNTSAGVLLGLTITNTKSDPATQHCQMGGGEWWHYMGPEFRLAGLGGKHMHATPWNNEGILCMFGFKTVDNGNGTYTHTMEILVDYGELGCVSTNEIKLTIGGVWDSGFAWLFGCNGWDTYNLLVTNQGVNYKP